MPKARPLSAGLLALALLVWAAFAHAQQGHGHGMGHGLRPEVMEWVERLAALEDRTTGSQGCAQAADMIEEHFAAVLAAQPGAGEVQVGRQRFLTPVMRADAASLTVDGVRHPVSLYQGNALSTGSLPGWAGEAYYVGPGDYADFQGLDVSGGVVLMDITGSKNWIGAANLGARAVIHVDRAGDDDDTGPGSPRSRYEGNFELNPVDAPRLFLTGAEAAAIFPRLADPDYRGALGRVELRAASRWERAEAENVYAFVPGVDPAYAEEMLVVQAHYDSQSFVAGRAPGADEALGVASLLELATDLGARPPRRSVLLVATAGHGQTLAGARELFFPLGASSRDLRHRGKELKDRSAMARRTLDLLEEGTLLGPATQLQVSEADPEGGEGPSDEDLVRRALLQRVKSRVEHLSVTLGRLRLAEEPGEELIKQLADERMQLRRISWLEDLRLATDRQRETLKTFVPEAEATYKAIAADARAQERAVRDARRMRNVLLNKRPVALVSLHFSGRGRGLGGFNQGWLYDLKERVGKSRLYVHIDEVLRAAGEGHPLYHDTLRPSVRMAWENYLPDRPQLGGEVPALVGLPGLTLATVHDARPFRHTPHDRPEHIDRAYAERQAAFAATLLHSLASEPLPDPEQDARGAYTTLVGQASFLRQGELFPDQPAHGALMAAFQGFEGRTRFYAMADTAGRFRIPGLVNYRETVHKAVLEGFKMDEETGRIVWSIDKKLTGKDNYRVRMRRRLMETDLIMFSCVHTAFFNTMEQRNFRYMFRPEVYDARTEATPIKYWYSRFDTWKSSISGVFMEPGSLLKLTLTDTVLGRKMLLTNAPFPDAGGDPMGRGYDMRANSVIPMTEYQVARDMWSLVKTRVDNLEERGIMNQRIRDLTVRGLAALEDARQAKASLQWDRFMESSKQSWALAARVYNDVDKTQKDVLFGVLFYVALFVPFAYCLERLVFGFAQINKRIVGFLGLLLATIWVIYAVHPAFKLTYSPTVVILAFFILGLSLLVSLIIFFRFEQEMANLQQRARHVRSSEISKAKAFAAAFSIGVSNLRRRPVRTVLTCATLVILTFTIMNFTAVKSVRTQSSVTFADTASYRGLLIRTLGWREIPREGLDTMANAFVATGLTAPRVWFEGSDKTQAVRTLVAPIRAGGAGQIAEPGMARAVVGLSHVEPEVTGLDAVLTVGRWFRADEPHGMLLPGPLAARMGVAPGDGVRMWGVDFTVTGVFDPEAYTARPDLDGEPMTPVIFPREVGVEMVDAMIETDMEEGQDAGEFSSRYEHIDASQTVIVPAETLMGFGGRVKALAVKPLGQTADEQADLDAWAERLTDRFGLMLFSGLPEADAETAGDAATGVDAGTRVYFASDALNYSGVPNIVIPLAIAILIVLNTMIGSVYERRGEIGIYTSVGLAPSHVGFLFIAEALAFAVISTVLGYLLAQAAAFFLAGTTLWAGMTANYSSLAGVAAMLLVIGVVLVSVIYPSKVAADIAIPDVNRSWSMPKAMGGRMTVVLPFLIKRGEQFCAAAYLLDYYRSHQDVSHGLFATDDIGYGFDEDPDNPQNPKAYCDLDSDSCFLMDARVWMAPFDFGVRQHVDVTFCPAEGYPGFLEIRLRLKREAGEGQVWWRLNKNFINDLRKQLLVWRSLDAEARRAFEDELLAAMADAREGVPGRGYQGFAEGPGEPEGQAGAGA